MNDKERILKDIKEVESRIRCRKAIPDSCWSTKDSVEQDWDYGYLSGLKRVLFIIESGIYEPGLYD